MPNFGEIKNKNNITAERISHLPLPVLGDEVLGLLLGVVQLGPGVAGGGGSAGRRREGNAGGGEESA